MFALLPLVGGLLLGWLAPRRTAIAGQTLFCVIAIAVLAITAPDHGGEHADVLWIAPAVVAASVLTLLLGFWFGGRTSARRSVEP
jgi:hypothetical protein